MSAQPPPPAGLDDSSDTARKDTNRPLAGVPCRGQSSALFCRPVSSVEDTYWHFTRAILLAPILPSSCWIEQRPASNGATMAGKVIVVDDSTLARTQIASILVGGGYEVVQAVDGSDGLAKIRDHGDAGLVLCDINMPNLSGLEVLAQISNEARARMIFLMLTTEVEPRLIQRAKALGSRGWIVKPFSPLLLLATVKKLIA